MTAQHSNRINLRLTDLEKADWAAAAGGVRKTSEWIRATCNRAAEASRVTKAGLDPEPTFRTPVPNEKPQVVKDAIAKEQDASLHTVFTAPSGEKCVRWMHHRKDTYCGSCKRVI